MSIRRFERFVLLTSSAALGIVAAGCFDPVVSGSGNSDTAKPKPATVNRPANPQPQPAQPFANRGANPVRPAGAAANFPPANPVRNFPPPAVNPQEGPASSGAQYIRLSTGTALPKTLPGGEQVMFTAEYQFNGDGPKSGVVYVLVVQGRGGKTYRYPLRNLKTRGELPASFRPGFRSTDAPFRGFIEEWPASSGQRRPGDGKRVSNVIPMS